MASLPSHVVVREVGLRDGLQSIETILPTERKREWVRDAHAAGLREIEVGSFVPPHLLPQLADSGRSIASAPASIARCAPLRLGTSTETNRPGKVLA